MSETANLNPYAIIMHCTNLDPPAPEPQNKIVNIKQKPFKQSTFVCPNEEDFNVWTIRLTQIGSREAFKQHLDLFFTTIEGKKQIPLALAFIEKSKRGIKHVHMRIVTTWKTRPSLLSLIKSHFPYGNKGNKFFQTHKCYVDGTLYDKSLLHSTNYIAKEADNIFQKGYSDLEVANIISESKKYNAEIKMPVYQKIMSQYDIKTPEQIPSSILEFYESIEKVPPKGIFVREIVRKILWKISHKYRQNYRKKITQFVDEELCEYI